MNSLKRAVTCILPMCGLLLVACQAHQGQAGQEAKPQAADAQKQPPQGESQRVIVKPFSLEGVDIDSAGGLESKFCHELARNKHLEVVCADDLKAIANVKQQQLLIGQCDNDECMANFAQLFEADRIVLVKIGKVGETFITEARLVDGKSGKIGKRFAVEKSSTQLEDLLPVMSDLAGQVGAGI